MRKLLFIACLSLTIAVAYFIYPDRKYAQNSTDSVNATIKIGVCGNGIVEGGEQCDGVNLDGKGCIELNYWSGDLTCDQSCSFDTTKCQSIAQTITPLPSENNTTANQTTSIFPRPVQTIQNLIQPIINRENVVLLPQLELFDSDQDGVIKTNEIFLAIKRWLGEWQLIEVNKPNKKCDINSDGICDLRDLSVLLYYVDRKTL